MADRCLVGIHACELTREEFPLAPQARGGADVNPTWPLRDALELARSILDDKVGVIEGSIILAKYAHEVVPDWRVDPDFVVCGALASSTDHLPFGEVRERWSSTALEKADAEIAAITESRRAEIRRACENIIARFGPGKGP